ncbi:MAG: hypothetical protein WA979_12180 [Pacificimonas sp.]
MSELFRDTELHPFEWDGIARDMAASPFNLEELSAIFETGVFPAFAFNLMDVAGNGTGWTPDDVRDIMLASPGRPRWRATFSDAVKRKLVGSVFKNGTSVAALIAEHRSQTPFR